MKFKVLLLSSGHVAVSGVHAGIKNKQKWTSLFRRDVDETFVVILRIIWLEQTLAEGV